MLVLFPVLLVVFLVVGLWGRGMQRLVRSKRKTASGGGDSACRSVEAAVDGGGGDSQGGGGGGQYKSGLGINDLVLVVVVIMAVVLW